MAGGLQHDPRGDARAEGVRGNPWEARGGGCGALAEQSVGRELSAVPAGRSEGRRGGGNGGGGCGGAGAGGGGGGGVRPSLGVSRVNALECKRRTALGALVQNHRTEGSAAEHGGRAVDVAEAVGHLRERRRGRRFGRRKRAPPLDGENRHVEAGLAGAGPGDAAVGARCGRHGEGGEEGVGLGPGHAEAAPGEGRPELRSAARGGGVGGEADDGAGAGRGRGSGRGRVVGEQGEAGRGRWGGHGARGEEQRRGYALVPAAAGSRPWRLRRPSEGDLRGAKLTTGGCAPMFGEGSRVLLAPICRADRQEELVCVWDGESRLDLRSRVNCTRHDVRKVHVEESEHD